MPAKIAIVKPTTAFCRGESLPPFGANRRYQRATGV
jgi:hypothetical protein